MRRSERRRRSRYRSSDSTAGMVKLGIAVVALSIGVAKCLGPQSGFWSKMGFGDVKIELAQECDTVNSAGLVLQEWHDDEGNRHTDTNTKYTDCLTQEGSHILEEHTPLQVFEAAYEFVPTDPGDMYQGGWGARIGGDKQKLQVPSDCHQILNTGKSNSTKYITCATENGDAFMREFSDWGVFQATYALKRDAEDDWYQGGWASRLGGDPQELQIPEECETVRGAGRNGNVKFIDCELPDGSRMLQEFTDLGIFEATYIFTREETEGGYEGGWGSRLGGKPQMLQIPDECHNVINVGKADKIKYVVCDTLSGDVILQEFTDWSIFEATYRFMKSDDSFMGN